VGEKINFLKEGTTVMVLMHGEKIIDVQIPNFVELKVIEADETSRRATITAQDKLAVLETGAKIGVPTFIKEGDTLKVDTRSGSYIERVGTKK